MRPIFPSDAIADTGTAMDSSKPPVQPEWWAALPAPVAKAPGISKEDLAALMRAASSSEEAGKDLDYIVVDVRRTDFEVS